MPRRLFIADDNDQFARLVAFVGRRNGWTCATFRNGNGLIAALHDAPGPALLLIDIMMPDMDGIETIDALGKFVDRDWMRIRFVTGGTTNVATMAKMIGAARALDVGPTIYKPVTVAELEVILAEESCLADLRGQNGD